MTWDHRATGVPSLSVCRVSTVCYVGHHPQVFWKTLRQGLCVSICGHQEAGQTGKGLGVALLREVGKKGEFDGSLPGYREELGQGEVKAGMSHGLACSYRELGVGAL